MTPEEIAQRRRKERIKNEIDYGLNRLLEHMANVGAEDDVQSLQLIHEEVSLRILRHAAKPDTQRAARKLCVYPYPEKSELPDD